MLQSILSNYDNFINKQADERTTHWFFVSSPAPVFSLLAAYFLFVYKIGPGFMKNRKPYNIDYLMIPYNVFQMIACGYILIRLVSEVMRSNLFCIEVDYSYKALPMARTCHIMYMLKIIDLFDTVFFTLRKKPSQVTFLHVYHHSTMVLYMWLSTKYVPGGQAIYLGMLNSLVHIVMYYYYLLTIWNPEYKRSIWWKKHLTQLQLIQFFFGSLSMTFPLFHDNCNYPTSAIILSLPQLLIVTVLFIKFYYKTYIMEMPYTPKGTSCKTY